MIDHPSTARWRGVKSAGLLFAVTSWAWGCGALNPAFVALIDPDGTTVSTIQNAPGHVVIQFVNKAEVDERLLSFLESSEGGNLQLTEAEKRVLRPFVRFRVQVTFRNGVVQQFEIVEGSSNLVDQNFAAQSEPDLSQNPRDDAVVICDVTRVELIPGSEVEVFIPAQLTVYRQETVTNPAGGQQLTFTPVERIDPQFRPLELDDVDEDNDVILRRNVGIRNTVVPVADPLCGSVIGIVMSGTLTVPFLDGVDDSPSYDQDDETTEATIGGRFEFLVTVQ